MKNKGSNNKLKQDKPFLRAIASLVPTLFMFHVAYITSNTFFGKYLNLSDRQEVAASISVLNLKTTGDEPVEYYLEAEYSYFYQGTEYREDSVSLNRKSSNEGYWRNLYLKLKRDQANNTVVAWINPDKPDNALLDKTIRLNFFDLAPTFVFILLFSGAGFVVLWMGIRPQKPESEGIDCEHKNPLIWLILLFGIFSFSLGLIACITLVPSHWAEGKITTIIPFLFLLIGGGLIAVVVKARNDLRILGPGLLYLDPLPGVIGGQVGGKFKLSGSPESPITITVLCEDRGGDTTNTIWQTTIDSNVQQRINSTRVTFLFDCPSHLPSSYSKHGITWIVAAKGKFNRHGKTIRLHRHWIITVVEKSSVEPSIKS